MRVQGSETKGLCDRMNTLFQLAIAIAAGTLAQMFFAPKAAAFAATIAIVVLLFQATTSTLTRNKRIQSGLVALIVIAMQFYILKWRQ